MGKIHLLDNHLVNNISAGEVVERPLSVVKELVENSIDSGANIITVEIKDGGITYIRVTDNGSGILKEDLKLAFTTHATSKITNLYELENVLTMGFRGEALSSIASVSQVEVVTKTSEDISGTLFEIHGSKIVNESSIGSVNGTTLIVRNLFYNTPARKKFLKKNTTESGYIYNTIVKFCLAHPNISFVYINNGLHILNTKGNGDLSTTIFQIYGKEVANKLLPVSYNKNDLKVNGYVGKPELSRGNRTYEHFFINKRFVKNQIVQSAVEECFKTRLPIGKFPLFVLNMEIEPSLVDVNVHPTKLEVRFSNDSIIYESMVEAINKAFENQVLIPESRIDNKPIFSELANSVVYKKQDNQPSITDVIYSTSKSSYELNLRERTPFIDSVKTEYLNKNSFGDKYLITDKINPPVNCKDETVNKPFFYNYSIKGQLFNTYWIIEQNNSIYLIDQHAAHEKVLYEQITNKLTSKQVPYQKLIQPIIVNLTETESIIVKENLDLLENFGFEVEIFDDNCFALKSVPFIIKGNVDTGFFMDIIDIIGREYLNVVNIYEMKKELIASMSCKAAVKANDKLSYIEAKELIEKILKLKDPFTCPHGRPTIIEITKYQIEKNFNRIQ